jgi:hypothetical protein
MIVTRDVGDIISEIQMTLAADPNAIFWLLEGVTDVKFFKPRLIDSILLIDSMGKYKVIETIKRIAASNTLKGLSVLGIVDNDYDWLNGYEIPPNIVSTEPRDLEGILLRANCVNCVLAEFGNKSAIEQFERREGPVIEAILARALIFGKVRAVNSLNNRVCLKSLKPVRFFKSDWTYDKNKLFEEAVQLGVSSSIDELEMEIGNLPDTNPWHYVRGHDAIDILCGGLISILGPFKAYASLIEPVLRQSLTSQQYQNTAIHEQSMLWHVQRNLPYPYREAVG